jgi:hypothetical protein
MLIACIVMCCSNGGGTVPIGGIVPQLGRIAKKSITLAGAALLNHGCYWSELLFAAHRMCVKYLLCYELLRCQRLVIKKDLGHAIIGDQRVVCCARSKHVL